MPWNGKSDDINWNIFEKFMKGVTPDGHSLHNLANISYTGILSVNLGVHIGVYQPWYSIQFGNSNFVVGMR